MRIPKFVIIQGVRWKINVVAELIDEDGTLLAGYCELKTKSIFISKDEKKDMLLTLAHEIFHAISMQSGVHTMVNFNQEQEEICAEQVANFVVQYFLKGRK